MADNEYSNFTDWVAPETSASEERLQRTRQSGEQQAAMLAHIAERNIGLGDRSNALEDSDIAMIQGQMATQGKMHDIKDQWIRETLKQSIADSDKFNTMFDSIKDPSIRDALQKKYGDKIQGLIQEFVSTGDYRPEIDSQLHNLINDKNLSEEYGKYTKYQALVDKNEEDRQKFYSRFANDMDSPYLKNLVNHTNVADLQNMNYYDANGNIDPALYAKAMASATFDPTTLDYDFNKLKEDLYQETGMAIDGQRPLAEVLNSVHKFMNNHAMGENKYNVLLEEVRQDYMAKNGGKTPTDAEVHKILDQRVNDIARNMSSYVTPTPVHVGGSHGSGGSSSGNITPPKTQSNPEKIHSIVTADWRQQQQNGTDFNHLKSHVDGNYVGYIYFTNGHLNDHANVVVPNNSHLSSKAHIELGKIIKTHGTLVYSSNGYDVSPVRYGKQLGMSSNLYVDIPIEVLRDPSSHGFGDVDFFTRSNSTTIHGTNIRDDKGHVKYIRLKINASLKEPQLTQEFKIEHTGRHPTNDPWRKK